MSVRTFDIADTWISPNGSFYDTRLISRCRSLRIGRMQSFSLVLALFLSVFSGCCLPNGRTMPASHVPPTYREEEPTVRDKGQQEISRETMTLHKTSYRMESNTETSQIRGQAVADSGTTVRSPFPTLNSPAPTQTVAAGPVQSTGINGSSSASPKPTSPGTSEVDRTLPPEQSNIPLFARNIDTNSLENRTPSNSDEFMTKQQINGKLLSVPNRSRESIVSKEEEEKTLKEDFKSWEKEQKQAETEKDKLPRYLQPLNNDRKIFDDPNSPYSRKIRTEGEKKFVRQITAADLNMMSDVVSTRELQDWEREQDMPIDWSKYSAKGMWNKWRDFMGMGPDEEAAVLLMREAAQKHIQYEETKNTKLLSEAANLYEKAGKKWPDSVLQEDALFYAGECRYFIGDYTKALENYRELVTKFSNSVLKRAATHRLFSIGCFWVGVYEEEGVGVNLTDSSKPRFSSFAGAKRAFESIFLNDASDKGLAPDAIYALANAYMRRGVEPGDASFETAARYYKQLYEFYPGCKYAEKSYLLAMFALHQSYRGPLYDDRPLREAQEIAEAAKRTGRGDKNLILEELESIKNEQAKHFWVRGQYYEKQGNYGSARSYYNRLANDFPNSPLTQEAAVRYIAIKDRPAETDQFSWIRPIMPILPKSDNLYVEDKPAAAIQTVMNQSESSSNNGTLQFSQLDKEEKKH